jgi:hypothetical protein
MTASEISLVQITMLSSFWCNETYRKCILTQNNIIIAIRYKRVIKGKFIVWTDRQARK